jgi:hypothetical protein
MELLLLGQCIQPDALPAQSDFFAERPRATLT